MATCQIVQFQDAQNDNQIQVAGAYNGIATATSSAAMNADTRLVRIIADATVYLDFTGAAATANSLRLPANTVEYFGVMPGQTISCYDGSS
jgi:hypothetical protein